MKKILGCALVIWRIIDRESFFKKFSCQNLNRPPRGGEFDFEEFEDELKQNNIDIANMESIKDIAIFCVGRKQ